MASHNVKTSQITDNSTGFLFLQQFIQAYKYEIQLPSKYSMDAHINTFCEALH